jgi:hypothetical protein
LASWTTKQSSGHHDAKSAAKIRVEFDQRESHRPGNASISGRATCDTHASIFFQSVTRGRCGRVRPIIGLPIRHGHGVQRPNRELLLFATICKSGVDEAELRRDYRHRRPVIMAA